MRKLDVATIRRLTLTVRRRLGFGARKSRNETLTFTFSSNNREINEKEFAKKKYTYFNGPK